MLTGLPSAGKTSAAVALAKRPGSPKVHLHGDDFWRFIKNGAISPYLPAAHEQNALVIHVLAKAAATYAAGGYFVILDGIIGPWFLEPFKTIQVPLHYVVLRPPLENAIERCETRGGDTLTAAGPIADLHQLFSSLGKLENHVLATDGLAPEDVLRAVIDAVRSGAFRLMA